MGQVTIAQFRAGSIAEKHLPIAGHIQAAQDVE
jgi:hypothetical protein